MDTSHLPNIGVTDFQHIKVSSILIGGSLESAQWLIQAFWPKILGGDRDQRIVILLENECSLSGMDNHRWIGGGDTQTLSVSLLSTQVTCSGIKSGTFRVVDPILYVLNYSDIGCKSETFKILVM